MLGICFKIVREKSHWPRAEIVKAEWWVHGDFIYYYIFFYMCLKISIMTSFFKSIQKEEWGKKILKVPQGNKKNFNYCICVC